MANSKNIWAATLHEDGGAFYVRDLNSGLLLPTDALDDLVDDLEFIDQGWMGEDGFTFAPSRETTKHRGFGGSNVKTTQDSYDCTVTATFMEQNPESLRTLFGEDNVQVLFTSGHRKMRIDWDDKPLPRQSFVQRHIDGVKTQLNIVPEGQIVAISDIKYVHSVPTQFEATIDCYIPEGGGKSVYTLTDEPDVTEPGS